MDFVVGGVGFLYGGDVVAVDSIKEGVAFDFVEGGVVDVLVSKTCAGVPGSSGQVADGGGNNLCVFERVEDVEAGVFGKVRRGEGVTSHGK